MPDPIIAIMIIVFAYYGAHDAMITKPRKSPFKQAKIVKESLTRLKGKSTIIMPEIIRKKKLTKSATPK